MAAMELIADFIPAAGALFEVKAFRGDHVESIDADDTPDGWTHVRLFNGVEGLVPTSFLAATDQPLPPPAALEQHLDEPEQDGACEGDLENSLAAGTRSVAESSTDCIPAEEDEEAIATAKAARQERLSWRIALAEFKPEPGATFEMMLAKGDEIEVVNVEWEIPSGWALVKPLHTDDVPGIVPEACLGAWPEEEEEKSFEEQKEAMEEAIQKAQFEKAKVKEELAEKEAALREAHGKAELAEKAKREAQEALLASSKVQEEMQNRMATLDATKKVHEQLTEVLAEVPRIKTIVDAKLEERKGTMSDKERVAKLKADVAQKLQEVEDMRNTQEELQSKAAATSDSAAAAQDATGKDGGEKSVSTAARSPPPPPLPLSLSEEQDLLAAEKDRAALAERIKQLDDERTKAVGDLTKAENRYLMAAQKLNAEDEASATRDRIIVLMPKVKELLAPTQDELMAHLEAMATTIMKQAEDSAIVLLETLARTNDPQEALRRGFEHKLSRGGMACSSSAVGRLGLERKGSGGSEFSQSAGAGHRLAPPRSSSTGSLFSRRRSFEALRAPPSLPSAKRGVPSLPRAFSGGRGSLSRSSSADRFGDSAAQGTAARLLRPSSASVSSSGSLGGGVAGRYSLVQRRAASAKSMPRSPISHPLGVSMYHQRGADIQGRTATKVRPRLSMPERMRRSISWRQASSADPSQRMAADAEMDRLIEQQAQQQQKQHEGKHAVTGHLKDKMDKIGVPEGPASRVGRLTLYRRGRSASDAHALRLAHARQAREHVDKLQLGGGSSRQGGFLT
jgi:hypothetical protein